MAPIIDLRPNSSAHPDETGEPPYGAYPSPKPDRATAVGRGLPTSSPSANPVGLWRIRGRRIVSGTSQAPDRWRAHPISSGPSRALLENHGSRGAVVRRALFGRVRDRRNPAPVSY